MQTTLQLKRSLVLALCWNCVVLSLSNAEECGQRPRTNLPLIFGGQASNPGDWPWHTAVYRSDNENAVPTYQCGGTLISDLFVLTTAQCTFQNRIPLPPDRFTLKLGLTILDNEDPQQKAYGVQLVQRHFKYDPWALQYDVALLKAASKVQLSDYIQPICLPLKGITNRFQQGTVVGWGFSERNQMESILQKASLNLVDDATCLQSNANLFSVLLSNDHSNFCAGNGNLTNVCNGDAGGGMFSYNQSDKKWYIAGIINAGATVNNRCDPRQYVAMANVTYYLDWIESVQTMRKPNLLELEDCGPDDHESSVPENEKPMFQQYPWMAVLEYHIANSGKIQTICSGILIHPRFVLTTGHCICSVCDKVKLKTVRLGDFDLSTNPDTDVDGEQTVTESVPVAKIIHHSKFNMSGYKHNLALIKLSRDAPTNMMNIQPICLPNTRSFSEHLSVVGWKRGEKPSVLEREQVQLRGVEQCVNLYKSIKLNLDPKDSFICLTNISRAHDCYSLRSGSALQYQANPDGSNRYYLKGMYALGMSRCRLNSQDVFVDIGYYLDWIKQTIGLETRQ